MVCSAAQTAAESSNIYPSIYSKTYTEGPFCSYQLHPRLSLRLVLQLPTANFVHFENAPLLLTPRSFRDLPVSALAPADPHDLAFGLQLRKILPAPAATIAQKPLAIFL